MGGGSGPAASRWIAGGVVEAMQRLADPGGGMERAADPNAGVEEAASAMAVLSRRQRERRREQDERRRHPGRGAGGENAGAVHRLSGKTATTLLQVRSPRFSFSFLMRGSGGGIGEKPRRRWRGGQADGVDRPRPGPEAASTGQGRCGSCAVPKSRFPCRHGRPTAPRPLLLSSGLSRRSSCFFCGWLRSNS
ncbi:hypothetical protein PVAP13_9NG430984 [Panicum virgatum]|uniref:Uncharacterized protein n=1 Tax=Panicum virgatum TaxID=38727 RepID=A0A8T0MRU2_PANVG|nr:hypothetical protein PVAP13_9NG430984 [Panicum virgatum]